TASLLIDQDPDLSAQARAARDFDQSLAALTELRTLIEEFDARLGSEQRAYYLAHFDCEIARDYISKGDYAAADTTLEGAIAVLTRLNAAGSQAAGAPSAMTGALA